MLTSLAEDLRTDQAKQKKSTSFKYFMWLKSSVQV